MNYENEMKICINLAKQGIGKVAPNPLVGCVVLNKDNIIVSQGYHECYGQNHAERNALLNIKDEESFGGTLVVNLEPCCHYGKTPPCTDLIIKKGIKKVVIGMRDVNPLVAGKGIKKLKDAGIDVVEGVLESDCKKLNEIFIKNMTYHEPFIAIKTATTIDGKIATATGSSKWITSERARNKVKLIREKYDAILTSSSTIIADNPKMLHKCKIVIDRELKTDFNNANIYKTGKSYVFYDNNIKLDAKYLKNKQNIEFIPTEVINNKIDVCKVLSKIYELGIMSVLVEAGGMINGSFLQYTDKIYHFIAPKILGDNNALSCFNYRHISSIDESVNFKICDTKNFDPDVLITYTR